MLSSTSKSCFQGLRHFSFLTPSLELQFDKIAVHTGVQGIYFEKPYI